MDENVGKYMCFCEETGWNIKIKQKLLPTTRRHTYITLFWGLLYENCLPKDGQRHSFKSHKRASHWNCIISDDTIILIVHENCKRTNFMASVYRKREQKPDVGVSQKQVKDDYPFLCVFIIWNCLILLPLSNCMIK